MNWRCRPICDICRTNVAIAKELRGLQLDRAALQNQWKAPLQQGQEALRDLIIGQLGAPVRWDISLSSTVSAARTELGLWPTAVALAVTEIVTRFVDCRVRCAVD